MKLFIYVSAPEGHYPKGIRSVFTELRAKEGFFGLYRGITPVMLRAFPANAVGLLFYCWVCKVMVQCSLVFTYLIKFIITIYLGHYKLSLQKML